MKFFVKILAVFLFFPSSQEHIQAKELKLDDLFSKDRVIEVNIKVSKANWDKLRFQSQNFFTALQPSRQFEQPPSPYTYVEASVTIDGVSYPKVGIRKKGFIGSQDTNRPSLKIKLDHYIKGEAIDGLDNLTFNNNKQDVTLMNQFLCYDLFDRAGAPGSRCGYARITVNGKNLGVYSHVESVRKQLLKREFGSSKGTLYEGTVVDFYEDWEGSFDRKTGKKKKGLEAINKVIDVMKGAEGTPVVSGDFAGRALVPTNGDVDDDWFKPGFDDSEWIAGKNGAGFETERGFEKLIQKSFDFREQMHGKATSVYLRFPFELNDLELLRKSNLALRMRVDDGFVAYINGKEVARFNAPENPTWDSMATGSRGDGANMTWSNFDLSKHVDILLEGKNMLAIHGMNNSLESSDFLIMAELAKNDFNFEKELWKLVDEEAFYQFWAIEGLLSFWDGYSGNRNNFFVYLNPETDKFHFMPWGTDCTFQKYSMLGVDRSSPRSVRTVGIICHRLYQIPSVRKKYASTMKKLLADHWDEEKLLAETERIEGMLEPHVSKEQARTIRYGAIREFIRNRRDDVEREINGDDMPLWNSPPDPPPVIGGRPGERRIRRGDDDRRGREEAKARSFPDAVKDGNLKLVKELMAKGHKATDTDPGGTPVIVLAVLGGDIEVIDFLLLKGANPDARGRDGGAPLNAASLLGRTNAAKALIKAGADVNTRNNQGKSPLDDCTPAWSDEVAEIVKFVEAIAQIKVDEDKVREGRAEMAKLLAANGAKFGKDIAGSSGIWEAAKSGDLAKLEAALAKGDIKIDGHDEKGITPLSWAAMAGHDKAATWLIEKGADVNAPNRDGNVALHGAAFLGNLNIAKLLIDNEAKVNARSQRGETPLDSCSPPWGEETKGIIGFIGGLLELKVDMEKAETGRPKIAALLKEKGGLSGKQLD